MITLGTCSEQDHDQMVYSLQVGFPGCPVSAPEASTIQSTSKLPRSSTISVRKTYHVCQRLSKEIPYTMFVPSVKSGQGEYEDKIPVLALEQDSVMVSSLK